LIEEAVIVKLKLLDWSPPGLLTETLANPGVTTSAAGTVAVSKVLFWRTVARGKPFHDALAPLRKFDPKMVNVNAALPA
jgi:hypothetical protein